MLITGVSLLEDCRRISVSASFYKSERLRLKLSVSAILIMSQTVASHQRTEESASLNEGWDTTPVIPISVISEWILPFGSDRIGSTGLEWCL